VESKLDSKERNQIKRILRVSKKADKNTGILSVLSRMVKHMLQTSKKKDVENKRE